MKINVDISKLPHKTYMEVYENNNIESYILEAIVFYAENYSKNSLNSNKEGSLKSIEDKIDEILKLLSAKNLNKSSATKDFTNDLGLHSVDDIALINEDRHLRRREKLEKSLADAKNKTQDKLKESDIEDAVEELARALDFFG